MSLPKASMSERITVARLLEDVRDLKIFSPGELSMRWMNIIRESDSDLSAFKGLINEIGVSRYVGARPNPRKPSGR